eukprot:m.2886 g.2886  ORF g.2886 m.2886 type:complete len:430 (+) comp8949_c0_seq1:610-1899(+)
MALQICLCLLSIACSFLAANGYGGGHPEYYCNEKSAVGHRVAPIDGNGGYDVSAATSADSDSDSGSAKYKFQVCVRGSTPFLGFFAKVMPCGTTHFKDGIGEFVGKDEPGIKKICGKTAVTQSRPASVTEKCMTWSPPAGKSFSCFNFCATVVRSFRVFHVDVCTKMQLKPTEHQRQPSKPSSCDKSCLEHQECLRYDETGEWYCADTCKDNGPCDGDEKCSLQEVECVRAPCPAVAQCTPQPAEPQTETTKPPKEAPTKCDKSCVEHQRCLLHKKTGQFYCQETCQRNGPCDKSESCQLKKGKCESEPCPKTVLCQKRKQPDGCKATLVRGFIEADGCRSRKALARRKCSGSCSEDAACQATKTAVKKPVFLCPDGKRVRKPVTYEVKCDCLPKPATDPLSPMPDDPEPEEESCPESHPESHSERHEE